MASAKGTFGVLCDTGFLIRLNNPSDALHANTRGYLRYFLEQGHVIFVSTIALAEYAVRDKIGNLPMKYFRVLPFNIDHAQKAGEFACEIFSKRDQLPADRIQRVIIPNDTKMFAQAEVTPAITHYLTADIRCGEVFRLLQNAYPLSFQIIRLQNPHNQTFGELNLGD
ncbi:MAG: hypothetical protein JWL81_1434 [Verrucomicrobiales bacterium]|nr:hypothetical protein [Verrucomicrobiales bacterium]